MRMSDLRKRNITPRVQQIMDTVSKNMPISRQIASYSYYHLAPGTPYTLQCQQQCLELYYLTICLSTVMNYYSRNSPRKANRNHQPGFLIPSLRTPKQTSRSKLKSTFNRYHYNSAKLLYSHNNTSRDMLIVDDSISQSSLDYQILIKQDQQEQDQKQKVQNKKFLNAIKQNRVEKFKERQQQTRLKQIAEDKIINAIKEKKKMEQKQIITNRVRNYSFGDKNHNEETNFSKQVPKNTINSKIKEQNKILKQKQKISSSVFKQNFIQPIKQEQNWQRLVKNFIKKRENSKQQQHKEQQIKITDQYYKLGQVNYETQKKQKQNNQIERELSQQKQQSSSNGTGYFRENSEQNLKHNQQLLPSERDKERKQSIRIEDDLNQYAQSTQGMKNSNEKKLLRYSGRVIEQIADYQIDQDSQQQCIGVSTAMLGQIISELPQKLRSTYQLIYQELKRKEQEAELTVERMKQTQSMLKLLIQLHNKLICVDQYLLADFNEAGGERVAGNQQIILGLVRQLALLI